MYVSCSSLRLRVDSPILAGDIDTKETMPVRWGRRMMSGIWCKLGKKDDTETPNPTPASPPPPTASSSKKVEPFLSRTPKKPSVTRSASEQLAEKSTEKSAQRPSLHSRSMSLFSISKSEKSDAPVNEAVAQADKKSSANKKSTPNSKESNKASSSLKASTVEVTVVPPAVPPKDRAATLPLDPAAMMAAVNSPVFDPNREIYSSCYTHGTLILFSSQSTRCTAWRRCQPGYFRPVHPSNPLPQNIRRRCRCSRRSLLLLGAFQLFPQYPLVRLVPSWPAALPMR